MHSVGCIRARRGEARLSNGVGGAVGRRTHAHTHTRTHARTCDDDDDDDDDKVCKRNGDGYSWVLK